MRSLFSICIMILASFTLGAQCGPTDSNPTSVNSYGGGGTASFGGGSLSNISANNTLGAAFLNQALSGSLVADRSITYQNVKGSPYLNDAAKKGTLVLNDGNMVKDILIHVDLYTDDFIATKSDGEEIILNGSLLREIIVPGDDNKMVVYKKTNPENPDKFYEVLYEDTDMVFFKQRYVTLREGSSQGLARVQPKFNNRTKYFMRHGDGQVASVKLKKKEIFSGFVDAELYAMKEYARENGIKFRDEEDYIAVFEAVNAGSENN